MKRKFLSFILLFLFTFTLLPARTQANIFDPGLILTDQMLFATDTMDLSQIEAFLQSHNGVLKNYYEIDVDGLLKTASMIIADAAHRHHINPQYLLILLQKEQGLITNPNPKPSQLDWATGYAACDTCDVNHPALIKYKGFAKQVDNAAWRTRYFVENPSQFRYVAGGTYEVSGETIVIKNAATAALYNYTPHISGNRLFWRLYQSWFASQARHPEGTLIQVSGNPTIWLIRNGQRHPFTNEAAFTSRFRFDQVVQVLSAALDLYTEGSPIKYPEYSLVRTPSGHIYLLSGFTKRWIVDEATFQQLGFTPDELIDVTEQDVAFFHDGEPIDSTVLAPMGALLQDPESYGIYFVQNGMKYPLIAPELLSLNYPHLKVRKATLEELERYAKGAPVKLRDGLLIKSAGDPTVYVIANGYKLPITSEYSFNALGYHWESIQTVSDALLNLHTTGDPLQVEPELSDEEIDEIVEVDQIAF